MAKNDTGNNATENNNPEDKLTKIEALAEKLSKTDTAFGARFKELMNFSTSISTTETLLKGHVNLTKEELGKVDKRLENCEKAISAQTTKTAELKKTIGSNQEFVTSSISRIEQPVNKNIAEQVKLFNSINRLANIFEEQNKLQKVMLWFYRVALAVIAISFIYYLFTLNKEIESLNNKLDNLSDFVIEQKQTEQPNTPDKKLPTDNKTKSNKK